MKCESIIIISKTFELLKNEIPAPSFSIFNPQNRFINYLSTMSSGYEQEFNINNIINIFYVLQWDFL